MGICTIMIPKIGFPWFLFISLGIHAFFEGFPLKDHHNIIIGVIIHKIPIAILITTYLLKSTLPKFQVVLFLIVFYAYDTLRIFSR